MASTVEPGTAPKVYRTPEDKRLDELAREYSRTKNRALLTEICTAASEYVQRVVMRSVNGSASFMLEREDFIQEGYVALLVQLEKYDSELNPSFTAFAFPRVFYAPTDLNRKVSGWSRAAERKGEEQVKVLSGDAPEPETGTSLFERLECAPEPPAWMFDPGDEFLSVENDHRVVPTVKQALAQATAKQSLSLLLVREGVDRKTTALLLEMTPGAVQSASATMRKRIMCALAELRGRE